jgi:hypothetical protein
MGHKKAARVKAHMGHKKAARVKAAGRVGCGNDALRRPHGGAPPSCEDPPCRVRQPPMPAARNAAAGPLPLR